jgi:hypothetical protein
MGVDLRVFRAGLNRSDRLDHEEERQRVVEAYCIMVTTEEHSSKDISFCQVRSLWTVGREESRPTVRGDLSVKSRISLMRCGSYFIYFLANLLLVASPSPPSPMLS